MTVTALHRGSIATAVGVALHLLVCRLTGATPWTDLLAEWIMARTPHAWSLWLLANLGELAKPFALTGGLSLLGAAATLAAVAPGWTGSVIALAFGYVYHAVFGVPWTPQSLSFWLPVAAVLGRPEIGATAPNRRGALSALMGGAVVVVAAEGYWRELRLAAKAVPARYLWAWSPPQDDFRRGWVRPAVTAVGKHYTMSKNSADPSPDPSTWKLTLQLPSGSEQSFTLADLLTLPRTERYVTLRCVSNTLTSDLMSTAAWNCIRLSQLLPREAVPPGAIEVVFLGLDGHGDSLPLDLAYAEETVLALGMNGETLSRAHGFPVRLLSPRYYGFKSVKWISEIRFVTEPYFGTWPRMGYTREPVVKTASHIDRVRTADGMVRVGGVSFAGVRGIRSVQVRTGDSPWHDAVLESRLSPYTWTRWYAEFPASGPVRHVEVRAMDGSGRWQDTEETPIFPAGVGGPTVRKVDS